MNVIWLSYYLYKTPEIPGIVKQKWPILDTYTYTYVEYHSICVYACFWGKYEEIPGKYVSTNMKNALNFRDNGKYELLVHDY